MTKKKECILSFDAESMTSLNFEWSNLFTDGRRCTEYTIDVISTQDDTTHTLKGCDKDIFMIIHKMYKQEGREQELLELIK